MGGTECTVSAKLRQNKIVALLTHFTAWNASVKEAVVDELSSIPELHEHSYQYRFTVDKDFQFWDYYQCACGKCTHDIRYKYAPHECPQHAWEFIGTEFQDRPTGHEILQVFRCDRCGATHRVQRHTDAAGITGRIEIDDPRVKNTLLLNKSSWERLISYEAKSCSNGKPSEQVVLPTEANS